MMRTTKAVSSLLMSSSDQQVTFYTCKDNNVWGSKSPEESEIVTLKAEVRQLKGNLQLTGKIMKSAGQQHHLATLLLSTKTKKEAQGGSGLCCH